MYAPLPSSRMNINSEEKHDPEATPLNHKSTDGTMMWKKSLNMYQFTMDQAQLFAHSSTDTPVSLNLFILQCIFQYQEGIKLSLMICVNSMKTA